MTRARLTRRGRIAVIGAAFLTALLGGMATADTCWTGQGFGSCADLDK